MPPHHTSPSVRLDTRSNRCSLDRVREGELFPWNLTQENNICTFATGDNECEDELSKRVARMSLFGPDLSCGISRTTVFHTKNKWSRDLNHQQ